jgi:hypothetical protein
MQLFLNATISRTKCIKSVLRVCVYRLRKTRIRRFVLLQFVRRGACPNRQVNQIRRIFRGLARHAQDSDQIRQRCLDICFYRIFGHKVSLKQSNSFVESHGSAHVHIDVQIAEFFVGGKFRGVGVIGLKIGFS